MMIEHQRFPAIKVFIHQLLAGFFHQEEPNLPLYVLMPNGEKLYRVNIVGTILNIEKVGSITNIFIDDGTGKIIVRLFEEHKQIHSLIIGNNILIVGKARVYNEEKYISPEIIKEISPLWLKVRSLEQQRTNLSTGTKEDLEKPEDMSIIENNPYPALAKLIKQLDPGDGALIEEVIEKCSLKETERLLTSMLEKGDIYQITPGKIKVL